MRKGNMLVAVLAIALSAVAVTPSHAVTLDQWAGSPITVGDKTFTLISTDWAGDDEFSAVTFSGIYGSTFTAHSDNVVTNTTHTLIFKVEIVDDPATPGDETQSNYISQVSGDGNRFIASGSFSVTGLFDDDSDFSSPLTTFSDSGTPWGPNAIAGTVQQLYVKLTFTASGGSTIFTGYSNTFYQLESSVPDEAALWGNIKALYR